MDELFGCGLVPSDPLDRAPSPQRIVDLSQAIGLGEEHFDALGRFGGIHLGPIHHGFRAEPHPIELGGRRHFTPADLDAKACCLSIKVIAVARCERGHKELAAVYGATRTRCLGGNRQPVCRTGGTKLDFVSMRGVADPGRNLHPQSSFTSGLTPQSSRAAKRRPLGGTVAPQLKHAEPWTAKYDDALPPINPANAAASTSWPLSACESNAHPCTLRRGQGRFPAPTLDRAEPWGGYDVSPSTAAPCAARHLRLTCRGGRVPRFATQVFPAALTLKPLPRSSHTISGGDGTLPGSDRQPTAAVLLHASLSRRSSVLAAINGLGSICS